jgi:uncharacterized membrane protein
MLYLILGLTLFFTPHLLREAGLRDMAVEKLGSVGAFKGVYSLFSLAGIGLIVVGVSASPFIMVFEPLYQYKFYSHILMLPAAILILAGNLPMSHLRASVGNPMLAGISLWGLAHLWANGDLASILLFGSFAVWGTVKFFTLRKSSLQLNKAPSYFWDFVTLVTGLSFYLALSTYHGQLFGIGLNFA